MASLVPPAVNALASRLFVLSTWRPCSAKWKPNVGSFYETGLVTSLYEQLLMSPALVQLEIRHEMPYGGTGGAPEQVDLRFRQLKGGEPTLTEAGDFSPTKVHSDLEKLAALNPDGCNWFLALFRVGPLKKKTKANLQKLERQIQSAKKPFKTIEKSFRRRNDGLDSSLVETDKRLTGSFDVYRPDGRHEPFGFALFKAK